jgi:hypothetical protein
MINSVTALLFIAARLADSIKEDGINFEFVIIASTWPHLQAPYEPAWQQIL